MSRPLVLLVDDERPITSIMRRKLEQNGYDVVEAWDGEEGLQLAREHKPDAIVTDLQMPHISGLEMSVALQKSPETASIPIIMLTGRGHYVEEAVLARTSVRQLLAKPFSARQILEALNQILGRVPKSGEAA
ncbi:MAG: hypothetical protein Kow0022_04270 [Phycisphaerales bacterium]